MPDIIFFPYSISLRENGKIETVPVAEVKVKSQEGSWICLLLIIDSGATISALPREDASVFGINLEKGEPLTITGINGREIKCWRHKIPVRLGKREFMLPVVFLSSRFAPRVLGREGLFEDYLVLFEEMRQKTWFISKDSQQAKQICRLLGD